jgi:hypothetical protein
MTVRRLRHQIGIACVLAACTACAGAPRQKQLPLGQVEGGPGTISAARQYLEGKWSLISLDVFPPGQAPIHAGATGTMTYDDFANMTVDLKVDNDTARLFQKIGIEAPGGVIRTTGKTLVDMNGRTLSYMLEGQALIRPATHPLDTNRPRYWEREGNTLTLRTKDDKGTVLSVAVWQKS